MKKSSLETLALQAVALDEKGYELVKNLVAECPSLKSVQIDAPAAGEERSLFFYNQIQSTCAARRSGPVDLEEIRCAMQEEERLPAENPVEEPFEEVDLASIGRMSPTPVAQSSGSRLVHSAASAAYAGATSFVSSFLSRSTPSR